MGLVKLINKLVNIGRSTQIRDGHEAKILI